LQQEEKSNFVNNKKDAKIIIIEFLKIVLEFCSIKDNITTIEFLRIVNSIIVIN